MELETVAGWLVYFSAPPAVYASLFGMLLLCGFGLPLPEDVTLIAGGYLAFAGYVNVHIVLLVSFLGVMIGDSTIFLLGHRYGSRLLRVRPLSRFLTEPRLAKAQGYFHRYGDKVFFIARFLPGLRTPIFFTGGSLHSRFRTFFTYDFIAALVSVPVWVYGAYLGGPYIHQFMAYGKWAQGGLLTLLLIAVAGKIWWSRRKERRA